MEQLASGQAPEQPASERKDELAKSDPHLQEPKRVAEVAVEKKRPSSRAIEETEEERAAREQVEQKLAEFKQNFDEEEIKKTDKDIDGLVDKLGKGKKKK